MVLGVKPLVVVDATNPRDVYSALAEALFVGESAILPRLGGAMDTRTAPFEVPSEAALVIETSGTTGKPKRVWLSAEALLWSARTHLEVLGGPGVWWQVLPVTYIAGIQVLTRSLVGRSEPVFSAPGPFGPATLLADLPKLVEAKQTTRLYSAMVPAQLQRLLDGASEDAAIADGLRLFDAILVGGQAIPRDLITRAAELGVSIVRTYGSAETAGGCVWNGVALPGVSVRDIDGRLAISGPLLAGGYLDDEALTAARFVEVEGARWYVTDDQGVVSSDGVVSVTGRVDDVIVSGGKKVSLAEVERILLDELGWSGAVVVSGPHPEWGHVPVVVSVTSRDIDEARRLVGSQLGVHARPDRVVVVPEIPVLASGKPDRVGITRLVSQ